MASAMLRSAKSAISRSQISRRSFFAVQSDPAMRILAPTATSAAAIDAGQPLSLLTKLSPLASAHSVSYMTASSAADASRINSRSEAFVKYSTTSVPADSEVLSKAGITSLRPLSPHLTIFKPYLNSTVSISNRISGALLVSIVLFSYLLCLKVGGVCFTYSSFYQLFFYVSKYLVPVGTEVTALALAFHMFYGIRHLITH